MGIIKRKLDLTAIIITLNEEKNINKCIKSINRFVKDIFVLDSGSEDKTLEILRKNKIRYKINKFKSFSHQYNTAIKLANVKTKWAMRIDADEIVDKKFFIKLKMNLENISDEYNGIIINRRYFFRNKEIRHGGVFPHETLRIWKNGFAKCENVLMDEKIICKPRHKKIDINIIDNNQKKFLYWKLKHKKYAYLEALKYLKKVKNIKKKSIDNISDFKRFYVYYKFPIFLRPFLLFLYSFFLRFGFLDGFNGLILSIWQNLWFRFLVDINIYNLKKKNEKKNFKYHR
jgi:glycosyltransferase involved in cell wall biosynthesis